MATTKTKKQKPLTKNEIFELRKRSKTPGNLSFYDPKVDVAFKKIFGSEQHKAVTISFLNAMLGYQGQDRIKTVTFRNTEQHEITLDKKDGILDVLCTDHNETHFLVEIQVREKEDFVKRSVFYATKDYVTQLKRGQSYRYLKPVVFLSILGFNLFPEKEHHKSIFRWRDDFDNKNDVTEIVLAFVQLKKFNKPEHALKDDEDRWIYFLKEIENMDRIPKVLATGEFEEACLTAEESGWSEAERNAFDDAITREADTQGELSLIRKEGRAEGLAEGELKKAIETATNLLAMGIDIKTVATATGLDLEQVKQLKKNTNA